MSLKMKLLAMVSLSLALVFTAACMGKKDKQMTKEQLEIACKDVPVDCSDVMGAATDVRASHCDYKCNKNYTDTSTSTSTDTKCSAIARVCNNGVAPTIGSDGCTQTCPEDSRP